MGTNYYLHDSRPCECCGRSDPPEHIGKSSGGWCFSLHVTDKIRSLADWVKRFRGRDNVIRDEYGRKVGKKEMVSIITDRKAIPNTRRDRDWLERNGAERGPNGLARHKVREGFCVGHGEGTWDLIEGEFS